MNQDAFEAHVQFELERWRSSLHEEIAAAWDWLEGVRLGDVVSDDVVLAWMDGWPGPDIQQARELHDAALQDTTAVKDLVRREDYDHLVTVSLGLKGLQESLVEQLTTSDVYSQLITHVLYHGIKNYVMTESPVAKVPGASAFMRFGQSAMDRGVPSLSKGIDRQLMSFVNANISDSLRESRAYLTSAIDSDAMADVTAEIWNRNADVTVAEVAALIPQDAVVEFVEVAAQMWEHMRSTEEFRAQVTGWLARHEDTAVADLLTDNGISADLVEQTLTPWLEQPRPTAIWKRASARGCGPSTSTSRADRGGGTSQRRRTKGPGRGR